MTPVERKRVIIEYMRTKMAEEDWHGVSDAANDLREIEVEISLAQKPGSIVLVDGFDAFGLPVINETK